MNFIFIFIGNVHDFGYQCIMTCALEINLLLTYFSIHLYIFYTPLLCQHGVVKQTNGYNSEYLDIFDYRHILSAFHISRIQHIALLCPHPPIPDLLSMYLMASFILA